MIKEATTSSNMLASNAVIGSSPEILTRIYEDEINLTVWQRPCDPEAVCYLRSLGKNHSQFRQQSIVTQEDASLWLEEILPQGQGKPAITADLSKMVAMFACLFDLPCVGLRVAQLSQAMCPRFHVDRVPCRMIVNYLGPGTEWLANRGLDRSKLGPGSMGLPDECSGLIGKSTGISCIPRYSVALLKGEAWQDNQGRGLVHRSPHSEEPRVLATLDFA